MLKLMMIERVLVKVVVVLKEDLSLMRLFFSQPLCFIIIKVMRSFILYYSAVRKALSCLDSRKIMIMTNLNYFLKRLSLSNISSIVPRFTLSFSFTHTLCSMLSVALCLLVSSLFLLFTPFVCFLFLTITLLCVLMMSFTLCI